MSCLIHAELPFSPPAISEVDDEGKATQSMAKRDHEESMTPAELNDAAYWAGFWSRIEHWMFLGVVLTLALEFVALKFAEPYKEKLEKHREFEMSRLSKEAESARADMAKANAETAKANEAAAIATERAAQAALELQKLQNPRTIDFQRLKVELEERPKGTASVMYVENCTDCEWLATWIFAGLSSAGWTMANEKPISLSAGTGGGMNSPAVLQGGQPWGVSVLPSDGSNPAAVALSEVFLREFGRLGGGKAFDLPDGVVRIIVAPRP
jgi:type II secretory pathway component PulM